MLTIIHVHEKPAELDRLLGSIKVASNGRMRVMVVDNSATPACIEQNRLLVEGYKHVMDVRYLGQAEWQSLCGTLPLTDDEKSFLASIRLGDGGWSTHNVRNVGMLSACLLYPDARHTWNLDQDIILPANLSLDTDGLGMLECTRISGCPDLSRLEWLSFYQLYLCDCLGIAHSRTAQDYAARLAGMLTLPAISDILLNYTEFPIDPAHAGAGDPFPVLIEREEFYGACYITNTQNAVYMVPPWPDEDWFFFQRVRGHKTAGAFLPLTVRHASVRKTILSRTAFPVEERGKMLNALYDINPQGTCTPSEFESVVQYRLNIIDPDIAINRQLAADIRAAPFADILNKINDELLALRAYVQSLTADDMLPALVDYAHRAAQWRRIVARCANSTKQVAV